MQMNSNPSPEGGKPADQSPVPSRTVPFEIPTEVTELAREAMFLTEELTKIPSVFSETEVAKFIQRYIKDTFQCDATIYSVADQRDNLFVTIGEQPQIVFTTHLDTVPFDVAGDLKTPFWSDDKTTLYARGACDAKGNIAAQLLTVRTLLELGQTNFGLLFVADEECRHQGAIRASTEHRDIGIEYIINGEPTESNIVSSHLGGYKADVSVNGIAAHSSKPHEGVDAGERLERLLTGFRQAARSGALGSDETLGNTLLNVPSVTVATADNVIPELAEARMFLRPAVTIQELERMLRKVERDVLAEISAEDRESKSQVIKDQLPGLSFEVSSRSDYNDYNMWKSRLPLDELKPVTVQFGSDLPFLDPLAKNGAVLSGAGSIEVAHKDREHITLSQMEEGIRAYLQLVQHFRS